MRKLTFIILSVLIQATGWTLHFAFGVNMAIRAANSIHLIYLTLVIVNYYESKIFFNAFDADMQERRDRKLD